MHADTLASMGVVGGGGPDEGGLVVFGGGSGGAADHHHHGAPAHMTSVTPPVMLATQHDHHQHSSSNQPHPLSHPQAQPPQHHFNPAGSIPPQTINTTDTTQYQHHQHHHQQHALPPAKVAANNHTRKKRAPKRPNHNELERKRRHVQKQRLLELREAVPTLILENPSTVMIVTRAKEYIEGLERRNRKLEGEVAALRNGGAPGIGKEGGDDFGVGMRVGDGGAAVAFATPPLGPLDARGELDFQSARYQHHHHDQHQQAHPPTTLNTPTLKPQQPSPPTENIPSPYIPTFPSHHQLPSYNQHHRQHHPSLPSYCSTTTILPRHPATPLLSSCSPSSEILPPPPPPTTAATAATAGPAAGIGMDDAPSCHMCCKYTQGPHQPPPPPHPPHPATTTTHPTNPTVALDCDVSAFFPTL